MKKILIGLLVISAFFSSCKKDEQVVVPNNTAPPDPTISNSIKEGYVTKLYISVLGREPDSLEFVKGLNIINQGNLSVTSRKQLIDSVLNKNEYYDRVYQISRTDLLNDLDTADITTYIGIFQFLLTENAYQAAWPQITIEINRLDTLRRVPVDLKSGAINVIEIHRRCVNNYFYDQLNMGTENFVVSLFSHFLFRYPTDAELDNSKKMVDGQTEIVFLENGKNKNEYMKIFFNSNNYLEGQVRDLYVRYLFRQPTSEETSARMTLYKSALDYKKLQKEILSLDEYVGI